MSRHTVTLTAPNGAKIRTVIGKRFYVVEYGLNHVKSVPNPDPAEFRRIQVRLDPPQPYARVAKRTDSAVAAKRELPRWINAVAFQVRMVSGQPEVTQISPGSMTAIATAEQRRVRLDKAGR
jgi:hypothetical protein